MKPLFFATIASFALFLTGCKDGTPSGGEITVFDLEAAIDNRQAFDLADISTGIEFIPLDNSRNEGLVGEITNIAGSKGRFYVQENARESPIKIFDRSGRFLTTEGRFGRGPGEYTNITSFAADYDTDNLYMSVISRLDGSLVAYDTEGRELIRRDSVSSGQMVIHDGNLLLLRNRVLRIGDDLTVGGMIPFLDSYSLSGLELETAFEAPDRGVPMVIRTVERGINVLLGPDQVLTSDGSSVLVKENLSDTVTYYRNGALEPAFILNSGDYAIPDGALGMDPSVDLGNSYAIRGVLGSEGFLFVEAYGFRDNVTARLVIDRDDPSGGLSATGGTEGKPGLFLGGVKFIPCYIRDNRLVGYMQALDIVDNAEAITDPELRALAATLKEDSNPVIVVATLKK